MSLMGKDIGKQIAFALMPQSIGGKEKAPFGAFHFIVEVVVVVLGLSAEPLVVAVALHLLFPLLPLQK